MSLAETASIEYIQTSLLPEEDFIMKPEEQIEIAVRQLKNQGLIEIQERKIPISPEEWSTEREKLEREYKANPMVTLGTGKLYKLPDRSRLQLCPSLGGKEYIWDIFTSRVNYEQVVKNLADIYDFTLVERALDNPVLTFSNENNTYIIDIERESLCLQKLNISEIQDRREEITHIINILSLGILSKDLSVDYDKEQIYKKTDTIKTNTYRKELLKVNYNGDIPERDLIGYSSLVLLSLAFPFNIKSVTRHLAANFTKNKYKARSLDFVGTSGLGESFIYKDENLILTLNPVRSGSSMTVWEIETSTDYRQSIISYLSALNPNAYARNNEDGNIEIIIPTPSSKEKTKIIVLGNK